MDDLHRLVHLEFNHIASELFQAAWLEFRNKISGIDRNGDENVFQLLRSQYAHQLRQQLEQQAAELIHQSDHSELRHRLQAALPEAIRYYEAAFMRKAEEE